MSRITLRKNRGWRGLTSLSYENTDGSIRNIIFTFSPEMWKIMYTRQQIAYEDGDEYVVVEFKTDEVSLPHTKDGGIPQRSVLIKLFTPEIKCIDRVSKSDFSTYEPMALTTYARDRFDEETLRTLTHTYPAIRAMKDNNGRATTSIWNNVGIRVTPII